MAATFGYGRVSTKDQSSENQRLEIENAGFALDYWFADTGISGKTPAASRPEFQKLLGQIRQRETLVVAKLDRLGRDSVDVVQTLRSLEQRHIRVFVLQLGQTDLTSAAGKLITSILAAVAEMERDLLVERTQSGLARAKAEGKKLGRPSKTSDAEQQAIRERAAQGESISVLARDFRISRANVYSILKGASA